MLKKIAAAAMALLFTGSFSQRGLAATAKQQHSESSVIESPEAGSDRLSSALTPGCYHQAGNSSKVRCINEEGMVEPGREVDDSRADWSDRGWRILWGKTPRSAMLIGMWTYHYSRTHPFSAGTNWQQNMIAFNYKSFFLGTFSNTYFRQSVVTGVRRLLWEKQFGAWHMATGYHAGFIYGYRDGHGMFLSKWSPVIPMVQLFYDITYHNVGMEIGAVPGLFSAGVKVRF